MIRRMQNRMQIVTTVWMKVQKIAAERNRYQVLPVSCEILSDITHAHRGNENPEERLDPLLYAGVRSSK